MLQYLVNVNSYMYVIAGIKPKLDRKNEIQQKIHVKFESRQHLNP